MVIHLSIMFFTGKVERKVGMCIKQDLYRMKSFMKGLSANAEDMVRKLQLPCLYPNCSEMPVGCHSQQCNGTLSTIANDDGMVIVPSKDAKGSISRILDEIDLPRGFYFEHISRATIFNGFCKKHDNDLFAPIEKVPLVVDNVDQVIAFHRRVVAVEVRNSFELIGYFKITKYMLEQRGLSSKNVEEEIHCAKERLRSIVSYEWNPLWRDNSQDVFHHVWRVLPYKIPVSLASSITPDFNDYLYTIYGQTLSAFGCDAIPRLGFTLTIVPRENKTHIIMIWNRFLDPVVRTYSDRLMSPDKSKVETFLNECIFCLSEDWCMSPEYWESLPQTVKNELRHILSMGRSEQVKSIPHIITL